MHGKVHKKGDKNYELDSISVIVWVSGMCFFLLPPPQWKLLISFYVVKPILKILPKNEYVMLLFPMICRTSVQPPPPLSDKCETCLLDHANMPGF